MGHYLTFNGVNTEDYGIIISGAGTYATPERDITPIPIPGRNGDLHVDNGRFNNIQVRFEAGLSKGFESRFLPFMNAMLSAPSYSRLETDYHPDEYRLGTFMAEMVPDVGTILRSGHFDLVFDCKPQRFLKAGEQALPQITGSGTPLNILVAEGSAQEIFSSAFIAAVGNVGSQRMTVLDTTEYGIGYKVILHYPDEKVALSDNIITGSCETDPTTTSGGGAIYGGGTSLYNNTVSINIIGGEYTMFETPLYYEIADSGDNVVGSVYPSEITIVNPTKFAAKPLIRFHISQNLTSQPVCMIGQASVTLTAKPNVTLNVSDSVSAPDIYLDCETMNAYSPITGYTKPYNRNGGMYAPLEVMLEPGANTVRYNNAVDYIEIIPRWWRI